MTALSRSVSASVIPKGDQPGAALSKADTRMAHFVHVVHRVQRAATAGARLLFLPPGPSNNAKPDLVSLGFLMHRHL
jgi:hypothetical protein